MILLFFISMWTPQPVASLDELGIYRETSLTMFKTETGYLLNSAAEGAAVLFDEAGRVVSSFRKQGQGPGEFNRQYVLKLDETGIHFCSNGRFVMSFDQNLKPTPAALPNLPVQVSHNITYGLAWRSESVLVALSGAGHLFAEIELQGKGWQLRRKHFPTQMENTGRAREFLRAGQRSLIHHQTVFASKVAVGEGEEVYEMTVLPQFLETGGADAASMVLISEIDEFRPFLKMRALITHAAQIPSGYVVELVTDMKRGGVHRRWHDFFDTQGRFQRRENANGKQLLPVVNDSMVFAIEDQGDDRVLVPLF